MKILVTGARGFLGSYLVPELASAGHEVTAVDSMSRARSDSFIKDNASKAGLDLEDFYPDSQRVPGVDYVQDSCTWEPYPYENEPEKLYEGQDVVINLAADVGGVFYNADSNFSIGKGNISLQMDPVFLAQQAGVKRFVQISSVCCYGYDPDRTAEHTEEESFALRPFPGNLGYALAKRVGEAFAEQANFEQCLIIRPTNMAGAGDWFDNKAHVLPALIRRAFDDEALVLQVWSPPDVVRQFIHPSDTAKAIRFLLDRGENGIFNVADGNLTTLAQAANLIVQTASLYTGRKLPVEFQPKPGVGYEMYRAISGDKLKALGWKARYNLSRIITNAVSYYNDEFYCKRGEASD